jgi:transglutaminase-like putative cysteine protease
MFKRFTLLLLLSLSIASEALCWNDATSSEFRDPTPAERAMTSVPFAPGASAVVLNWYQYVNDRDGYRTEYVRIKILTEQGNKYGDVAVEHLGLVSNVDHIKARTVRPDGTIAPFDGKTFDKVVVKMGGRRLIAKTFTLPDVHPGSIIEYRYDISTRGMFVYDSEFQVQRELPVIREDLLLQPWVDGGFYTFFSFRGLPPGREPVLNHDVYELHLENIRPYEEEPFSPPVDAVKPKLQFWYSKQQTQPAEFWARMAREWADVTEPFIGDGREVRDAVTAVVAAAATPEEKLRMLYTRVQQIRNTSYEPDKTETEARILLNNKSAQDVLRNGYGDLHDINMLFVAMARAAGFDAHVVRICERDEQYLARNLPVARQLDGEVALVTVAGKSYFLDPATPYAPFGTLSWQKSSTAGLVIARKQNAAVWVETPRPLSDAATRKRVADLQLDNGVVRGTVTVIYRGQEALRQRFAVRNDDDATARKSIEDALKASFAEGSVVKLTEVKDLRSAEAPLIVSATVELPAAASVVGSRAMVPLAVFTSAQPNPFPAERRTNDIYFHYANETEDDVTLKLPTGYDVESLPAASDMNLGALRYAATYEKGAGTIQLVRKLAVDAEFLSSDKYPAVRNFFSRAAAADQEQVVLHKSSGSAN